MTPRGYRMVERLLIPTAPTFTPRLSMEAMSKSWLLAPGLFNGHVGLRTAELFALVLQIRTRTQVRFGKLPLMARISIRSFPAGTVRLRNVAARGHPMGNILCSQPIAME